MEWVKKTNNTMIGKKSSAKKKAVLIMDVFRMYDTDKPITVQLYCHVSVMKYLIDNFGDDFAVETVDDEHFKATVSVCASTTFYCWVFGFNGKIKISEPSMIKLGYKEMLQSALAEM